MMDICKFRPAIEGNTRAICRISMTTKVQGFVVKGAKNKIYIAIAIEKTCNEITLREKSKCIKMSTSGRVKTSTRKHVNV